MSDPDSRFVRARDVIRGGLDAKAFPAATIEVGRAAGPLWREAFGALTYDAGAPPCTPGTIFDLASLTKVIATASTAMRVIDAGQLTLETRIADLRPDWRGEGRDEVTVRHLLEHSSGLPAHVKLYEVASGRAAFEARILATPLAYRPGAQAVYSDLGFMLLGFLLEDAAGGSLDDQFAGAAATHVPDPLSYRPPASWRDRIAPTEIDPASGLALAGVVHDENARALGGVAGHAGVFGTASAVGAYARAVLQTFRAPTWLGTPARMREFATVSAVPGSTRALAWDTMRPTSSCGRRMSESAIGHTGFTGTSLWIDPRADVYVVFLTNRVHPTRTNEALVRLRPAVHDAVMDAVGGERLA